MPIGCRAALHVSRALAVSLGTAGFARRLLDLGPRPPPRLAAGAGDRVALPENGAALVGAGILSILIFPLVALSLRARGKPETPTAPEGSQAEA
ncbi:MAG TPA: hypothetical protein VEI94_09810, partial [Candidatus Bathyarchaeia archaeon]|nr:hypothetical protein [Candidatus Bathyarchaeia archaeon]